MLRLIETDAGHVVHPSRQAVGGELLVLVGRVIVGPNLRPHRVLKDVVEQFDPRYVAIRRNVRQRGQLPLPGLARRHQDLAVIVQDRIADRHYQTPLRHSLP
ncbi:hypothetical protein D3C71_1678610 [compost metagenome]